MNTVHRQRFDALQALLELAEEHGLPMPLNICMTESVGQASEILLSIRLDNDCRADVTNWAKVLEIRDLAEEMQCDGFTSVKAQAWSLDGPTWRGLYRVDVWSACDRHEAGEQA